jgi:AraC-like DNA-binding protein
MTNRFRTEDQPARTQADYWQHVLSNTLAPYQIRPADGTIRGHIHHAEIGPVTVLGLRATAMQASRTPDLIRDSDRGMYKIDLALRGRGVFEQDGRESVPKPGEFILVDLGRPSHVAIEQWHEGSILIFPRSSLPLRHDELRKLTAVRFTPRDPYAALVSSLVKGLTRNLDAYESARDARIATAFTDLLSLAVATALDRVSGVPPESRQHAMMLRIHSFIDYHLGDPDLSPGMIAAAHHISVRTLHKLHESEQEPIAASIRRRRLERCRRDLLNPSLSDRPAGAIGARWGFPDAATFSRAFRAAYGLPPGEYRATQVAASALVPAAPEGDATVRSE